MTASLSPGFPELKRTLIACRFLGPPSLCLSLSLVLIFTKSGKTVKSSLCHFSERARRCNAKHKQKSPRAAPTVASAPISERVGAEVTAAGMLGNHRKIQGRAVQDPLGAAAGGSWPLPFEVHLSVSGRSHPAPGFLSRLFFLSD